MKNKTKNKQKENDEKGKALMYQNIESCANFIKSQYKKSFLGPIETIIVLGSGLSSFADEVKNPLVIDYKDLPYFPKSSVAGHPGKLLLGTIKSMKVAVLQGRVHYYEGHSIADVVFPLRVLSLLGDTLKMNVILSNAAGAVNKSYRPGDLVLISDHINFMGQNPLIGKNEDSLGERFPDMSEIYSKSLRAAVLMAAKKQKYKMKEGVYMAFTGPSYESPSEIKMARLLGADMVGMSTVPEAIAAKHCGMNVCAISCITNMAAGILKQKLSHTEVQREGKKAQKILKTLLIQAIENMKKSRL